MQWADFQSSSEGHIEGIRAEEVKQDDLHCSIQLYSELHPDDSLVPNLSPFHYFGHKNSLNKNIVSSFLTSHILIWHFIFGGELAAMRLHLRDSSTFEAEWIFYEGPGFSWVGRGHATGMWTRAEVQNVTDMADILVQIFWKFGDKQWGRPQGFVKWSSFGANSFNFVFEPTRSSHSTQFHSIKVLHLLQFTRFSFKFCNPGPQIGGMERGWNSTH